MVRKSLKWNAGPSSQTERVGVVLWGLLAVVGFCSPADTQPMVTKLAFVEVNGLSVMELGAKTAELVVRADAATGTYVAGPAWSPDGRYLAYSYFQGGRWDIYSKDIVGGGGAKLLASYAEAPAWSPEGERIVFSSMHVAGSMGTGTPPQMSSIIVMNRDGTGKYSVSRAGEFSSPTWSPTGDALAFVSSENGEIYVSGSDGENLRQVTQTSSVVTSSGFPARNADPSWSPDGHQIAFVSNREGRPAIYVMDIDGGNQRRLSAPAGNIDDHDPGWSPDGRQIVFSRDSTVWIMNSDGTGAHALFPGSEPAWGLADTAPSLVKALPWGWIKAGNTDTNFR